MKLLNLGQPKDLGLLHDELLAACPELHPVRRGNRGLSPAGEPATDPVMTVHGRDHDIWLTVPDTVDGQPIAAVVIAHDITQSQVDPRKGRLGRVAEINAIYRSDWTLTQMRELIRLLAQGITNEIF